MTAPRPDREDIAAVLFVTGPITVAVFGTGAWSATAAAAQMLAGVLMLPSIARDAVLAGLALLGLLLSQYATIVPPLIAAFCCAVAMAVFLTRWWNAIEEEKRCGY